MRFALKYRPRTIEDVIGQGQTQVVLRSMLSRYARNDIVLPPALLFTGPRGTGKTSTARIVAAGLNCEGNTGVIPCADCVMCRSVYDGLSDSVLEINAATDGLVDNIRKLSEISRQRHYGKYRVFILDEVHRMQQAAFSALLKQLEEPQPQCMYILVTTEISSVPETIRSRMLSFVFASMTPEAITEGLERVCQSEELAYESAVLPMIAYRANGGMRDALMMLEHLNISHDVTIEGFNALWPNPLTEFPQRLFDAIEAGDVDSGLRVIRDTFKVNRNCWQMIDSVVGWLTASSPFIPAQTVKLIELAWELRVRSRAENPQEPVLVEALFYLYLKELNNDMMQKLVPLEMVAYG